MATRKSVVNAAMKGLKNPKTPKTVASKKTRVEKDDNSCGANSCNSHFHESLLDEIANLNEQ